MQQDSETQCSKLENKISQIYIMNGYFLMYLN